MTTTTLSDLKIKSHKQEIELMATLTTLMYAVENGLESESLEKKETRLHTAYIQTLKEINALEDDLPSGSI